MSAERRPGELKYEPTQTDENFLEQLVDSVNRIHVGLDATYAAVVRLDEHTRGVTGSRSGERTVNANYVEFHLTRVLCHASAMTTTELLTELESLRQWVNQNGVVQP